MIDSRANLINQLESIICREQITTEPQINIDGLRPALLIEPASTEEAARCLLACAENDSSVIPAGAKTWLECGNPLERADVVLSLGRMNRVIDYSPADLTITVEAGLALSDLNAVTGRERQWLPFDPPGAKHSTLGAIAACNSAGALRFGFGMPRDYVLGLRLAHVDGTESKSGGRVVKNVAGYDLNKLYVGSYGTLGVITEITFKLRPLAEIASTALIASDSREPLFAFAKKVMSSELMPASLFLTNRLRSESRADGNALLIRFIESEVAVKHQIDLTLRALSEDSRADVLDETEAEPLWARINDWHEAGRNVLRLSVPLSEVTPKLEAIINERPECAAVADIGAGIIRMAFDADDESTIETVNRLRENVSRINGAVVIERAPAAVRRRVDAWGEVGATARLMQSIKAKYDPQAILNPGRFVAGI